MPASSWVAAGYERVPIECVPWRRRIVRPFQGTAAAGSGESSVAGDSLGG